MWGCLYKTVVPKHSVIVANPQAKYFGVIVGFPLLYWAKFSKWQHLFWTVYTTWQNNFVPWKSCYLLRNNNFKSYKFRLAALYYNKLCYRIATSVVHKQFYWNVYYKYKNKFLFSTHKWLRVNDHILGNKESFLDTSLRLIAAISYLPTLITVQSNFWQEFSVKLPPVSRILIPKTTQPSFPLSWVRTKRNLTLFATFRFNANKPKIPTKHKTQLPILQLFASLHK